MFYMSTEPTTNAIYQYCTDLTLKQDANIHIYSDYAYHYNHPVTSVTLLPSAAVPRFLTCFYTNPSDDSNVPQCHIHSVRAYTGLNITHHTAYNIIHVCLYVWVPYIVSNKDTFIQAGYFSSGTPHLPYYRL